jgi:hypothetical protein
MRRVLLSAVIAIVVVSISTIALVQQSHSLDRRNSAIRVAIASLAIPGLTVGTLIDMAKSHNIHGGGGFDLPVLLSIPANWLLYYFISSWVLKLRPSAQDRADAESRKKGRGQGGGSPSL